MKSWKIVLAAILALGLLGGSWLIGCGDDNEEECGDICNKIDACMPAGYSEQECQDRCEDYESDVVDCAADCGTDWECMTYGVCLRQCAWVYGWWDYD